MSLCLRNLDPRAVLSTGGTLLEMGAERHGYADSLDRCILCKPVTCSSIKCKLLHAEGAWKFLWKG